MVENSITDARNVVDLLDYRRARSIADGAPQIRLCRHCQAPLGEGESEDDCSSAMFSAVEIRAPRQLPRKRAMSEST